MPGVKEAQKLSKETLGAYDKRLAQEEEALKQVVAQEPRRDPDDYNGTFLLVRNHVASAEKLKDVQAARTRIIDGTFGVCPKCDHPIDEGRLAAYPHVKYCAGCQTKMTRSGRPPGIWK